MSAAIPIPDVPFVIGIGGGPLHAIEHKNALWAVRHGDTGSRPRVHVTTACDLAVAVVAREWGEFRRGNEHLLPHQLCPTCAWTVALHHGTGDAELAAWGPSPEEAATWDRLLPDPPILTRTCQRILDDWHNEDEEDRDHPHWAQLLGHVCAHRPEMLVSEECLEGDHDHEGEDCPARLACATCSVKAGSWDGEWQGRYEVAVPAPCSALLAAAGAYEAKGAPA